MKSNSIGIFDFLKQIMFLLSCLCDLDNKSDDRSTLSNLKLVCKGLIEIMIQPLIADLKKYQSIQATPEAETNAHILAKWWLTYLSLLTHAFSEKQKQLQWGSSKANWFLAEESKALLESIEVLEGFYHWKILLLRGTLLFARRGQLLESIINKTQWLSYFKDIKEMLMNFLQKELDAAKLSSEISLRLTFRKKILEVLRNILEKNNGIIIQNSILRGRFDKKIYPDLSHSIILGWDGGLFALFNSATEEEMAMLLEGGEISEDYVKTWKKNENNLFKIIIGMGGCGKIRLSMVLTGNETSSTMKPGDMICVKKSLIFEKKKAKTFRLAISSSNVWNDYSSGEMSHFTFSPEVYDMMLQGDASSFILESHQKGYTMQEFVPVFDGSKIFEKNGKYYQNWEHQKNFLSTVFQSISNLLKAGICMTDLKPANTLYDAENGRGMLIDLAGVVRFDNEAKLKKCQAKCIQEFTKNFADPIICEKGDEETVDLLQCTAFAFGKFIEVIVLNLDEKQFRPHHLKLKKMSHDLMVTYDEMEERNLRMTVEEGLKILEGIPGKNSSTMTSDMTALEAFMKSLAQETRKNLAKFGLNPELPLIADQYIDLLGAQINPDIYEQAQLEDLQIILQKFIEEENANKMKDRIMVLLGSSGYGKSTILQLKYLKALDNLKINDPVPLFINLTIEDNLKQRWNLINKFLMQKLNFNLFSGIQQYPMSLFVDSFDEMAVKMNYVSKFLKELGNNALNRILICCRSEFMQKDQDFIKWFGSEAGLIKWFIAPLILTKFNLEDYAINYYEKISNRNQKEPLPEEKKQQILLKIKDQNLKPLLRTGYMVHLSLEVLPEILDEKQKITRRIIYEKYSRRKIVTAWEKKKEIKAIFKEQFQLKEDQQLIEFIEQSGQCLARISHKIGSSKVSSSSKNGKFGRIWT